MGEGQGEGEESGKFNKLFIPLPFIPSRQGRGNFTFYDSTNLLMKIGSEDPPPSGTSTPDSYLWI
jgi:hypothetical protein